MLVTKIRNEMVQALKNGDKARKDTLSMLVSALDLKAKEKRENLTEDEEFAVLRKELKQTQETLDTSPVDRQDIIDKAKFRISVINEFIPSLMSEVQIREVVENVLKDLNLDSPNKTDKGKIMKILMPKVKGKADGKLVNIVLESYFK